MLSIKTKAATAGSTCKFTGQVEWKIYRKPCCFSSNRSFLAKFPVNQLWESRHVLFFIIWSSYFISPRYEQQNRKGVLQRSNLCICFISACRSQLGPWIKILGPADWDDPQGPGGLTLQTCQGCIRLLQELVAAPLRTSDLWHLTEIRGPLRGPLDGGVGLGGGGRVGIISGYPNLNSND